ncbi:hypothetical protein EJ06DRAFT_560623 [Trichodelitschia bisporula]|uniref:Uncharacterized protein n=1 Tax=Trichodelitschia bisporula TaxID=703511 RepID=A0A6G1HHK4_9PEZI|nr:hypothetical protein EJ06DRAFT_560623 [Trichodelitschia bisporula]
MVDQNKLNTFLAPPGTVPPKRPHSQDQMGGVAKRFREAHSPEGHNERTQSTREDRAPVGGNASNVGRGLSAQEVDNARVMNKRAARVVGNNFAVAQPALSFAPGYDRRADDSRQRIAGSTVGTGWTTMNHARAAPNNSVGPAGVQRRPSAPSAAQMKASQLRNSHSITNIQGSIGEHAPDVPASNNNNRVGAQRVASSPFPGQTQLPVQTYNHQAFAQAPAPTLNRGLAVPSPNGNIRGAAERATSGPGPTQTSHPQGYAERRASESRGPPVPSPNGNIRGATGRATSGPGPVQTSHPQGAEWRAYVSRGLPVPPPNDNNRVGAQRVASCPLPGQTQLPVRTSHPQGFAEWCASVSRGGAVPPRNGNRRGNAERATLAQLRALTPGPQNNTTAPAPTSQPVPRPEDNNRGAAMPVTSAPLPADSYESYLRSSKKYTGPIPRLFANNIRVLAENQDTTVMAFQLTQQPVGTNPNHRIYMLIHEDPHVNLEVLRVDGVALHANPEAWQDKLRAMQGKLKALDGNLKALSGAHVAAMSMMGGMQYQNRSVDSVFMYGKQVIGYGITLNCSCKDELLITKDQNFMSTVQGRLDHNHSSDNETVVSCTFRGYGPICGLKEALTGDKPFRIVRSLLLPPDFHSRRDENGPPPSSPIHGTAESASSAPNEIGVEHDGVSFHVADDDGPVPNDENLELTEALQTRSVEQGAEVVDTAMVDTVTADTSVTDKAVVAGAEMPPTFPPISPSAKNMTDVGSEAAVTGQLAKVVGEAAASYEPAMDEYEAANFYDLTVDEPPADAFAEGLTESPTAHNATGAASEVLAASIARTRAQLGVVAPGGYGYVGGGGGGSPGYGHRSGGGGGLDGGSRGYGHGSGGGGSRGGRRGDDDSGGRGYGPGGGRGYDPGGSPGFDPEVGRGWYDQGGGGGGGGSAGGGGRSDVGVRGSAGGGRHVYYHTVDHGEDIGVDHSGDRVFYQGGGGGYDVGGGRGGRGSDPDGGRGGGREVRDTPLSAIRRQSLRIATTDSIRTYNTREQRVIAKAKKEERKKEKEKKRAAAAEAAAAAAAAAAGAAGTAGTAGAAHSVENSAAAAAAAVAAAAVAAAAVVADTVEDYEN